MLFSNMRIKYKIFVLIAALMGGLGLITNFILQYAFGTYDSVMYKESSKALSISSMGMENELKKISTLSFSVVTDPDIQAHLWNIRTADTDYVSYVAFTKIRERMVELGALDKYVLSMQLYDVNDKEYAVGTRPVTLNQARLQRLKWEAVANKGGITWVPPDDNDSTLTATRNIRRYEELSLETLGILAIRVDVSRLFSDYAKGLDNEDSQFIILKDDEVVYPEQETDIKLETLTALEKEQQGYKIIRDGGKSYFITYLSSAYTDWTYYTVTPYDQIFYTTVRMKSTVILIYGLLFVAAVLLAYQISRRITVPLEKLSLKMKRVQLGHFDYQDEENSALPMDEVGQMQRNFRIMVERINELIQENYVKQLAIKDTQFKALQAQINPHFLYNTLETINWSAKMSNQTRISQMVESLGALLRLSINTRDPVISLSRELEIINPYITIQRFRFEERLDFHIDVPSHLHYCSIPKLSVQPLVENAINYALEQMIEPCTIRLAAAVTANKLRISVEDNGPGMEKEFVNKLRQGIVKPKGTGLGLQNIEERIKILYGEEYGLEIESDPGQGTKVTLVLPYEVRDEHV
ncbi:cache domain-containing sensor histidine kinase [Paenibacillus protaetiae]|uniref:histidine kinase n=1 Tax=Paenibacillus protaetiae TaxID=2509456 RepID=A0A4P6EWD3_9BACL|nr:sensor histidine kinase [Paenibacillus protaetiae]QAY66039.1 sensor histidine kinase [Paenibacillus protaetiae]